MNLDVVKLMCSCTLFLALWNGSGRFAMWPASGETDG